MNQPTRRHFISAGASLSASLLFLPQTLMALTSESVPLDSTRSLDADLIPDRDLEKILRELPHARPHIDRIQAACGKYAHIFPVPLSLPAKVQAIESSYNCDAISNSYAIGGAQFMHATARELGARLPDAASFQAQEDVLALRRQYQKKLSEAVAAFNKGDDTLAKSLRTEGQALQTKYDTLHEKTMADFKQRMFALSADARRDFDSRFDPAQSDDMLVHYLALLARTIKNEMGVTDNAHILLLAGVAFNAGPGSVKRKPGIPVVAQNVEYANKLMLFQQQKL